MRRGYKVTRTTFIRGTVILTRILPLIVTISYLLFSIDALAMNPSKRLVSLTIMTDEILWKLTKGNLSKTILSLSPLADNASYSCIAGQISALKKRPNYSIEQIVAMNPDLVLAANFNRPSILKILKESAIKVQLFNSYGSFKDLWRNIFRLGEITGEQAAAKQMVSRLKKRLKLLSAGKKKLNLIGYSSELLFPGKNTSFDEIVNALRHNNIVASINSDHSWVRLSIESLIKMPIDFVIVGLPPNVTKAEMALNISKNMNWRHVPAVKNKKFLFIPNAYLLSLSHCMVDAVEMLHREIYEHRSR